MFVTCDKIFRRLDEAHNLAMAIKRKAFDFDNFVTKKILDADLELLCCSLKSDVTPVPVSYWKVIGVTLLAFIVLVYLAVPRTRSVSAKIQKKN